MSFAKSAADAINKGFTDADPNCRRKVAAGGEAAGPPREPSTASRPELG